MLLLHFLLISICASGILCQEEHIVGGINPLGKLALYHAHARAAALHNLAHLRARSHLPFSPLLLAPNPENDGSMQGHMPMVEDENPDDLIIGNAHDATSYNQAGGYNPHDTNKEIEAPYIFPAEPPSNMLMNPQLAELMQHDMKGMSINAEEMKNLEGASILGDSISTKHPHHKIGKNNEDGINKSKIAGEPDKTHILTEDQVDIHHPHYRKGEDRSKTEKNPNQENNPEIPVVPEIPDIPANEEQTEARAAARWQSFDPMLSASMQQAPNKMIMNSEGIKNWEGASILGDSVSTKHPHHKSGHNNEDEINKPKIAGESDKTHILSEDQVDIHHPHYKKGEDRTKIEENTNQENNPEFPDIPANEEQAQARAAARWQSFDPILAESMQHAPNMMGMNSEGIKNWEGASILGDSVSTKHPHHKSGHNNEDEINKPKIAGEPDKTHILSEDQVDIHHPHYKKGEDRTKIEENTNQENNPEIPDIPANEEQTEARAAARWQSFDPMLAASMQNSPNIMGMNSEGIKNWEGASILGKHPHRKSEENKTNDDVNNKTKIAADPIRIMDNDKVDFRHPHSPKGEEIIDDTNPPGIPQVTDIPEIPETPAIPAPEEIAQARAAALNNLEHLKARSHQSLSQHWLAPHPENHILLNQNKNPDDLIIGNAYDGTRYDHSGRGYPHNTNKEMRAPHMTGTKHGEEDSILGAKHPHRNKSGENNNTEAVNNKTKDAVDTVLIMDDDKVDFRHPHSPKGEDTIDDSNPAEIPQVTETPKIPEASETPAFEEQSSVTSDGQGEIVSSPHKSHPPYCKNPDMYASLSQDWYPNAVEQQHMDTTKFDSFQSSINSFDDMKKHMKQISIQPKSLPLDSYARDADPEAHFHSHSKFIHQKQFPSSHGHFGHQGFHESVHEHSFGTPNFDGGHDFESHHAHPHITINKQHNSFQSGGFPAVNHQNFQISQTNGHTGGATQFQSSLDHSHHHFGREAEIVSAPYLTNVPLYRNPFLRRAKRSAGDVKDDTYNVMDMLMKKESQIMEKHTRRKRTMPLVKLIADPNTKLDVPKTLENLGTITRQSFENKRAPMYHIRNMMGSAKDVVLSAMRVAPQDLIIPSQYKIIDKNNPDVVEAPIPKVLKTEESNELPKDKTVVNSTRRIPLRRYKWRRNGMNVEQRMLPEIFNRKTMKGRRLRPDPIVGDSGDFQGFAETFQKVGTVLRESIRSGQDTLRHMGDVAQSARKALATAKFSAPRVLLPYAKAPALLSRSQFGEDPPDKVMLIAPKILHIENDPETPHPAEDEEEFVQVGEIMDALGLSSSLDPKINLTKLVFHHKMIPESPPLESRFQSRSNFDTVAMSQNNSRKYFVLADIHEPEEDVDLQNTLDTLKNAKDTLGTATIKEFLLKMKIEFDSIKNELEDLKAKVNLEETVKTTEPPTLKDILSDRKAKIKDYLSNKKATSKPAETSDLSFTDKENTKGVVDDAEMEGFLEKLFESRKNKREHYASRSDNKDEESQRNIKENIKDIFGTPAPNTEVVGAGLALIPELYKPFMGRPSKQELENFYEEYGDSFELPDDGKQTSTEIVGAINPVMFRKYFHEPLNINNSSLLLAKVTTRLSDTNATVDDSTSTQPSIEDVGSMKLHDKLLKPFLGKLDFATFYDYSDSLKGSKYEDGRGRLEDYSDQYDYYDEDYPGVNNYK